jgi:drug/metabolite transporter (DMT)-like permease
MPAPRPDPAPERGARAPAAPPAPWVVAALIALLCLIWGSTWLVIREGLADLPPFTSAGVRFLVAALVVALLAPSLRAREGGAAPRAWLWIAVGSLNFGLSYGIVYWAETRLPSGLVALLWSLFPMLMAVSGHLFLPGERLRAAQWLGFALGFAGVALLFLTDLRSFGPAGVPTALVLCASPLVSAFGTTALKRHGSGASSALVNRNAMSLGAVLLLGAAALFERDADVRWSAAAAASVLYLALVGTVVTFTVYFWLLRHAPAYKLSLIAYVVPALALLLGWAVGGEPVTVHTLGGALLILAGVALVARRGRRGPAPAAAAPPGTTAAAPRIPASEAPAEPSG